MPGVGAFLPPLGSELILVISPPYNSKELTGLELSVLVLATISNVVFMYSGASLLIAIILYLAFSVTIVLVSAPFFKTK